MHDRSSTNALMLSPIHFAHEFGHAGALLDRVHDPHVGRRLR